MQRCIYFVTGTDTGAGKTVATCLLARFLRAQGRSVAALKPLCSGGRGDARKLHAHLRGTMSLDEINPWHFRAALAPLIAARREHRRVTMAQVTAHVRAVQRRFPVVLVEGAGGLLSPLGENFDSRDLIEALEATPIIVTPNRLGAINQVLLTCGALPRRFAKAAEILVMSPRAGDAVARTNVTFLRECLGAERVHVLPWLKLSSRSDDALRSTRVRRTLASLLKKAIA